MGKYKIIEKKLCQITDFLLKEDELVRLLSNENNINNNIRKKMINNNIYKYNYIPNAQEKTKSIICFFIDNISINDNNPEFFDGILVVDIIVHKKLLDISGGDRLLQLCDIVDSLLTNNRQLGIGGSDVERTSFWRPSNSEFLAYNMTYKLINYKK